MGDFMALDLEPTVYVIAGPNGAGKTTFATKFLPDFVQCREFVNADLIAAGLSPFAPETQAMRAGRLLLTRIKELSKARQNFGFETTLAGRSYAKVLSDLKAARYRLVLFFLWLPDADLAVARVANRVLQGGHTYPKQPSEGGLTLACGICFVPTAGSWTTSSSTTHPNFLLG